jgi:hypothetical protein
MYEPQAERSQILTNGIVRIRFLNITASRGTYEQLRGILGCHFVEAIDGTSDFTVEYRHYEECRSYECGRDSGQFCKIRRSTAPPFNLSLRIHRGGMGLFAIDKSTQTGFVRISPGHIVVFVSRSSLYHVLELVRYSALLVEESRGNIVLHASAVSLNDTAILIVGSKGAGKTTTLIGLTSSGRVRYLSGDKVLVTVTESGALVRGWPDYPHVGIGTLRQFPDVARRCGIELDRGPSRDVNVDDKLLIAPELFLSAIGGGGSGVKKRIGAIIWPDVNGVGEGLVEAVDPLKRCVDRLKGHVEVNSSYLIARWHQLMDHLVPSRPPDFDQALLTLCKVPWVTVRGNMSRAIAERLVDVAVEKSST